MGNRVVWKAGHELGNGLFRIKAYMRSVGPDERTAENAARQSGNVVAFQRLEGSSCDLRRIRDLAHRHTATLARLSKVGAEVY